MEVTPLVNDDLEMIDLEDDQQPEVQQQPRFRWGRTVAAVLVLGIMGAALVAGASHASSLTKENVAGVQEKWGFPSVSDAWNGAQEHIEAAKAAAQEKLAAAQEYAAKLDVQKHLDAARAHAQEKLAAAQEYAAKLDVQKHLDTAKAHAQGKLAQAQEYAAKLDVQKHLDTAKAHAAGWRTHAETKAAELQAQFDVKALMDKAAMKLKKFTEWGPVAQGRAEEWFNDVINYEFKDPTEVLDAYRAGALAKLKAGLARIQGASAEAVGAAMGALCQPFNGGLQDFKTKLMDKVKKAITAKAGPCVLNFRGQECKDDLVVKTCDDNLPAGSLRLDLCEVLFHKVFDRVIDDNAEWGVTSAQQNGDEGWIGFVEQIQGTELAADVHKFCAGAQEEA